MVFYLLFIQLTTWIIYLTPVGVCFLIAGQILETNDLEGELSKLGMYFLTVMIGLVVHGFIILPLLYFAVTRSNPLAFIFNMGRYMLLCVAQTLNLGVSSTLSAL